MSCGFDIGCYVSEAIAPWLFWIKLGFWVVVALVALYVLYRVKLVFGWYGVGALLTLGILGGVFKLGRDSAEVSNPTSEGDFDAPARPKRPHRPYPPIKANDPDGWLKKIFRGDKTNR